MSGVSLGPSCPDCSSYKVELLGISRFLYRNKCLKEKGVSGTTGKPLTWLRPVGILGGKVLRPRWVKYVRGDGSQGRRQTQGSLFLRWCGDSDSYIALVCWRC